MPDNLRIVKLCFQKKMFAEHPYFLVEDGDMFGFVTTEPL